jgi:TonB family protein
MSRAVVVSLVGHALVLWLLLGPLPHAFDHTTQFAILDHPSTAHSSSPPSGAPSRHPTPSRSRHVGRPRPIAPAPAAAEPVPIAPPPTEASPGTLGTGDANADGAGGRGSLPGVADPDRSQAPDFDEDSCTRDVTYPWKARLLDKEGVVHLRVTLDASGKVVAATVTQKAGYGFDETAREAVLTRCRFTAALDRQGRPTTYVIDDYRYHFRFEDFFHDQKWRPTRRTAGDH